MSQTITNVINDEPLLLESLDPEKFSDGFVRYYLYLSATPWTVALKEDFDEFHKAKDYKNAVCSCGQPDARRAIGLKVTAGTCEHLRIVLKVLKQQHKNRVLAYRVMSAYKAGHLKGDKALTVLADRAANGDYEARHVHGQIKYEEEKQRAPIFSAHLESQKTDLAKELFG